MGRRAVEPGEKTVRFTVRLPEPLLQRLQRYAKEGNWCKTTSDAVRAALEEFLAGYRD